MLLFVDSDANPQTGDPTELGADYVIEIFGGEAALFRWDGTNFTRRAGDPPATSLIFGVPGRDDHHHQRRRAREHEEARVLVRRRLGDHDRPDDAGPRLHECGRRHRARRERGSVPVRGEDHASDARRPQPEADTRRTPRLDARSRSVSSPPAPTRTRSCRTEGSRASDASGNARLKAQVQRVQGGAATCTWNLPPGAKGKTFRGSVAVVFEGLRAAQSFSGKVR